MVALTIESEESLGRQGFVDLRDPKNRDYWRCSCGHVIAYQADTPGCVQIADTHWQVKCSRCGAYYDEEFRHNRWLRLTPVDWVREGI